MAQGVDFFSLDQYTYIRFQRFQHCKASPKLPVLPTNPAGSLPSAEAAGTGVDRWDEPDALKIIWFCMQIRVFIITSSRSSSAANAPGGACRGAL